MKQYKNGLNEPSNKNMSASIIEEMRLIHGRAIVEARKEIDRIMMNEKNATVDDYLVISSQASKINLINDYIKECEIIDYRNKKGVSDSNASTNLIINANRASSNPSLIEAMILPLVGTKSSHLLKKNKTATGTEEISVCGINSDAINEMGNQNQMMNTTEAIDNLSTTYASDMASRNQKGKGPDIDNPTIINYWASWCPASNNFKPEWDKFKERAKPNMLIKNYK